MSEIEGALKAIADKIESLKSELRRPFQEMHERERHEQNIQMQQRMINLTSEIVESNKNMAESNKEMVKSNKEIADSNKNMVGLNRWLVVATIIMAAVAVGSILYNISFNSPNIVRMIGDVCQENVYGNTLHYDVSFNNIGKSAGSHTLFYKNSSASVDFTSDNAKLKNPSTLFILYPIKYSLALTPLEGAKEFSFTLFSQIGSTCESKTCIYNRTIPWAIIKINETEWTITDCRKTLG